MPSDPKLIKALQDAIDREHRASALYRMLGDGERDSRRKEIFYKLAAEEDKHARLFGDRVRALGGTPYDTPQPITARDRFASRMLGVEAMLRRMEAEEER